MKDYLGFQKKRKQKKIDFLKDFRSGNILLAAFLTKSNLTDSTFILVIFTELWRFSINDILNMDSIQGGKNEEDSSFIFKFHDAGRSSWMYRQ